MSAAERERLHRTVRKREREWLELMDGWEEARFRRQDRIKQLCRYGIPDSLRARVWMLMTGAETRRQPGLYQALLTGTEFVGPTFEQIEKDIHRCFPTHSLFAPGALGQGALRNVLRAFAAYNRGIGYCQGMGMVAGVLLMRMPEEESFWVFVAIVERYLEGLYAPGLEQLIIDAKVFERLLPSVSRKVSRHLARHEVDALLYITPWFMTLFSTTLPWPTLLRLWDMFLCEGIKPVFRMALAIMKSCKGAFFALLLAAAAVAALMLMAARDVAVFVAPPQAPPPQHTARAEHLITKCNNVSDILEFLLHIPPSFLQGDALVSISLSLSVTRSQLDNLIDKYRQELRKS
jgi:hypothetical protein